MNRAVFTVQALMRQYTAELSKAADELSETIDAERRAYLRGVADTLNRMHGDLQPVHDSCLVEIDQTTTLLEQQQAKLNAQLVEVTAWVAGQFQELGTLIQNWAENPTDAEAVRRLVEFAQQHGGSKQQQ